MKNQNRYGKEARLLALLLSALVLLGAFPMGALAAQTGSLTVKLRQDIYDDLPKDEAVKVTLYQIGVAAPGTKAGWEINDAFSLYGILGAGSSGELAGIAEKIAGDIVGKDGFSGKEQTLENGQTRFSNLEQGVYLGVLTSGPEGLEADPFIVTVPSRNPETKDVLLNYDVILKETCVTEATVHKAWDDANDQDGIRPASLRVKLSNGQSVTLNAANNWTATIGSLPRYKDGVAIAYTWTEEGLPVGYELTGNGTNGTVTTLTNSHTPETISLTVRKVWDDANNQDGLRPASLTVQLSNGTTVIRTATLSAENNWTATVDNLPRFENGKEIAYTWTEEGLPAGYVLAGTTRNGTVTTLTNSHAPMTSATVRKVWDDDDDRDGIRPANLTVRLSNGQSVTLNAANDWTATIDKLPRFKDGEEITYTWTEEDVPYGYSLTNTATEGNVTTLTNSHTPEVVSATVRKVWDDAGNQDGIRPASLTVTLSNGQSVILNADNNWEATIDGLPRYDKGVEINYSWTENDLPEGYLLSNTVAEGMVSTLTNSHTPETTSRTVRKVWQDENNEDGSRPTRLNVTLWDGFKEVGKAVLDAANNWEATIDDLPKNRAGKEIAYYWTEDATVGYLLREPVIEGNVTTLTNVHVPRVNLTEINGQKVWEDNHNEHKVRPANITVLLYADGTQVNASPIWRSRTGDTWSYTFSGLPAQNANGDTIHYTVDEQAVEYYDKEVSGTTITNRLVPRQPQNYQEIKGVKTWEDDNNTGGTRPDSVKVSLFRDGVEIASVVITEATDWSYSFGRQPMDDGYGNQYHYEVREDGVPGYLCRVDGFNLINKLLNRPNNPNPGTWTNSRIQPTGGVSVFK